MKTTITYTYRKYILLAGDIIVLYSALTLALFLRSYGEITLTAWQNHALPFSVIFLIMIAIFYIDELYDTTATQRHAIILNKILRDILIGGSVAIIAFYLGLGRPFNIKPQTILILTAVITAGGLIGWRALWQQLSGSTAITARIIFIGYNNLVQETIAYIQQRPNLGLIVSAIIATEPAQTETIPVEFHALVRNDNIETLKAFCQERHITTIITATNTQANATLTHALLDCLTLPIAFFNTVEFYENISGKIPTTSIEQLWPLEHFGRGQRRGYHTIKRFIDILSASLLLLLALPWMVIVAFAIKITSHGPALFRQQRTGKNGIPFTIIKFRTMVAHAEKHGPQWATKNDPRVTPLGLFFRKVRIDELPQLYNILKGDMSLIGPRPERPEFIEQLEKEVPFYRQRLLVAPGLTGWAQVMGPAYGGSVIETMEKIQYDLYYVKHQSLGLDLSIALKTIKTILSRKGS